jgi:hypothetical protein
MGEYEIRNMKRGRNFRGEKLLEEKNGPTHFFYTRKTEPRGRENGFIK